MRDLLFRSRIKNHCSARRQSLFAAGGAGRIFVSLAGAPLYGPRRHFIRPEQTMTPVHRPVQKGDTVFLVDGSNFIFRAFFQSMRQDPKYNYRTDKLPTGAVRLFCTKLFQFVEKGAMGISPRISPSSSTSRRTLSARKSIRPTRAIAASRRKISFRSFR